MDVEVEERGGGEGGNRRSTTQSSRFESVIVDIVDGSNSGKDESVIYSPLRSETTTVSFAGPTASVLASTTGVPGKESSRGVGAMEDASDDAFEACRRVSTRAAASATESAEAFLRG